MIDIHTHILPETDDGARDLEESLGMARVAVEDGIASIVATPHAGPGNTVTKGCITEKVAALQKALDESGIPVKLYAGAEVYIDLDLARMIAEERAFTINGGRYLLLELPFQQYPLYTEQVIFELQIRGINVIIAHPERNTAIQDDPNRVADLVHHGVLMQITSSSLLGDFGARVQKVAETMLQRGFGHIISSDAHSLYFRPPTLSQAVDHAAKFVGRIEAEAMVTKTPQAILANRVISVAEPVGDRSRLIRPDRR